LDWEAIGKRKVNGVKYWIIITSHFLSHSFLSLLGFKRGIRKTTLAARKIMLPINVQISLFFQPDAIKKIAQIIKSIHQKRHASVK